MKSALGLSMVALGAGLLTGCPRPVHRDGGPDSGYDPVNGNPFTGSISLDDERVRGLDASQLRAGATPCREPVLVRVERIIDGDTVHVVGEGVVIDVTVRMIGLDTPEIARDGMPGECYGIDAQSFTAMLDGRLVWLTFDNSCFDTFSRLLAYVHVGPGEGDLWQRQLLRRGYATVLTVGDDRTFASRFEADANSAITAGAGMWSACF